MKRKIIALIVGAALLLIGTGCSSGGKDAEKITITDPARVAGEIKEKASVAAEDLVPVPHEIVDNYYPGLAALSEEYEILINGPGGKVDEVAVIIPKDGVKTTEIETVLKERVEAQKARFVDYVPAEMPKLENAAIETVGNGVVLLISEDDTPSTIITDLLKGQ